MRTIVDDGTILKQIVVYFIGAPGLLLFWIVMIFYIGLDIEIILVGFIVMIIPLTAIFQYKNVYIVRYDGDFFHFKNLFSSFKIEKSQFKCIKKHKWYNPFLLYFCIGGKQISIEKPSNLITRSVFTFEDPIDLLNAKINKELQD